MGRHQLRVILVLEAVLEVDDSDDAAQQVVTLANAVTKARQRGRWSWLRNMRIALDEPGGEPVASRVIRYLDEAEGRLPTTRAFHSPN
jgi:hypothetical protein